jgi:hypothetical protein
MTTPEHAPENPETASLLTDAVEAMVGLAAAVAANGAEAFRQRYDEAVELGVPTEDLLAVVKIAQRVKNQASHAILEVAERRLSGEDEEEEHGCCGGGGCGKKEGGGCCGGGGCGKGEGHDS